MPAKGNSDEGKKTRASTSATKGKSGNRDKADCSSKCNVCSIDFDKESDKLVQCEYCNKNYCGGCLDLSEQDYKSFRTPSLHWFCPTCEAKVLKSLKMDQEVEARCSEFMKAMEGRVARLESDMKEKASVTQVEGMIAEAVTNMSKNDRLESDIKEKASMTQVEGMIAEAVTNLSKTDKVGDIEESINSKVSEIRDSASREKNVIIHGFPESSASDTSVRKQYDADCVKELFRTVEVDQDIVKGIVRLGKKRVDNVSSETDASVKPRPMKVSLSDVDSKQSFLKSLSKLKNAPKESIYHKVSIVHDMSKAEREKNKEMVEKAKTLNEQDKSGKVKHVVRGPPWERRIVQIKVRKD